MKKLLVLGIMALALAGCAAQPQAKVPAIDLTSLDTTVAPGADFYQYATGGWQKIHPLKPEYSRYGSFDMLGDTNQVRINNLFQSMLTMKAEKGSVDQKISDLYRMALDSTTRNSLGGKPMQQYISEIQAISSKAELAKELGALDDYGEGGFMNVYVNQDMADSKNQILFLGQSGLGMRNRDYYVDPANKELKAGYRNFLAKVFALAGIEDAEKAADNALAVEDKIAKVSWSSVQERDMLAQNNPMSTAELEKAYPAIGFKEYFAARNIADQNKLNVDEPSYFKGLNDIFAKTDVKMLKDYLLGQYIQSNCGSLSDEYYTAYWDFFNRQMAGAKQEQPRWRRAMQVPNSLLGQAVGKMYVDRYFPESSKQKMVALVENLRKAFNEHIDSLDWMSDSTKQRAHEKLAAFTVKIGYPDKWKDYSTLEIDTAKTYFENLRNASKWYVADNMSKLGKPTDKSEWGMTPQTVNAYYNPSTNEICFPAAILQPPFFNPDADEAVNYGGIGVVICHEMTHGFDDEGRLYDKDGNMTDWWTAADAAKFKEKAEKLATQFDSVEVLPGMHADGHHTLGENIADHGGLSISFSAMENAIKDKRPGLIDGFTPEQRFYLGYAEVWAQNITDKEIARRTKMDEHSVGKNRVDVSVRNFKSFFDAFGIKEGDSMWRPVSERVSIW